LVFEVINQPSGVPSGIGAPIANKYSYILTGFQERHIALHEDAIRTPKT
jgi:hypothetical protein